MPWPRAGIVASTCRALAPPAHSFLQQQLQEIKEAAGKLTDNEKLEAEGKADQAGASAKKAGENVKDVFKNEIHQKHPTAARNCPERRYRALIAS